MRRTSSGHCTGGDKVLVTYDVSSIDIVRRRVAARTGRAAASQSETTWKGQLVHYLCLLSCVGRRIKWGRAKRWSGGRADGLRKCFSS